MLHSFLHNAIRHSKISRLSVEWKSVGVGCIVVDERTSIGIPGWLKQFSSAFLGVQRFCFVFYCFDFCILESFGGSVCLSDEQRLIYRFQLILLFQRITGPGLIITKLLACIIDKQDSSRT